MIITIIIIMVMTMTMMMMKTPENTSCLTVTIDRSKRTNHWLLVFIANNITA